MIIQNASEDGTTDLTFTVSKADYKKAIALVEKTASAIQATACMGTAIKMRRNYDAPISWVAAPEWVPTASQPVHGLVLTAVQAG